MTTWGYLKRRVVVAAVGALLVGTCSGALAAQQLARPLTTGGSSRAAITGGATTTPSAQASATATRSPTVTAVPPTPTVPPPTPTIPSAGNAATLRGTIEGVSASSFTLHVGSGVTSRTFTISIDQNTVITLDGAPSTMSALNAGMGASVSGVWQSASVMLADPGWAHARTDN